MSFNIYEFYKSMENNNVMLSFKGNITSELLTSILQIMETKMENMEESPKIKKKVYNILVECLQNLYHHTEEIQIDNEKTKTAIFMIGKENNEYTIITGNYIKNQQIPELKSKLDKINSMSKEELKEYYKEILTNGEISLKGGGGLGIIDIARKAGRKIEYDFIPVDDCCSFFSFSIKVGSE